MGAWPAAAVKKVLAFSVVFGNIDLIEFDFLIIECRGTGRVVWARLIFSAPDLSVLPGPAR